MTAHETSPEYQTIGGVGVDISGTGDITVLIDRFLVPAFCQLIKSFPVMENDQLIITIRRKV